MANTKKRVLSLLMAAVMMLSAMPMNAFAIDWDSIVGGIVGNTIGELVCEKQEMDHTEECYVHTGDCYHKHSEPVYVLGYKVSGCEYACTAHTHSIEAGCPIANCDAHAHSAAECGYACGKDEHKEHNVLCCSREFHEHSWLIGCNKLTCTKKSGIFAGHFHGEGCYSDELVCGKTAHLHTEGCTCSTGIHEHSDECGYACGISTEHTHDADCYSCEIVEHTHSDACERLCGEDGKIDSIKCALQDHTINCTNEQHHTHTLEQGCYLSTEAVRNAVYDATGVVIEDPVELGAVLSTIVKCMTNSGACHVDYKVIAVSPYLELSLVLCGEHFCSICHRLNDGYCTCVELTFTNIYNVADNSVTVKVAAGTAAGAVAPHADMTDYQFMGWFDANGNEFNAGTVYTEDITFTASYRELGEAEKLMNTIEFIKNNFDLGTEIGRIITMLTNGEVNKEKFLSEKETALNVINTALMTARLAGQLTEEQAEEIYALMNQGDEYVVMVAEWLWPTDAVEMPNIEDILNGIDYEKLAAELLVMINERYGVDAWINSTKEQAEEYIINLLAEAKSITEAQKAALLEQIAQGKAEAVDFVNNLYNEVYTQVMNEVQNAKDTVKAILADREMGLRIGEIIKKVTGLNNEKASDKGVMAKAAIVAAIQMSNIDSSVKTALVDFINDNDNGVTTIIDWMWPLYTVNFFVDGAVVESDVVEHGNMPSFDGAEPTKAATAQYTYTFAGWDAAFAPVTGNTAYTATFASSVNEYVVTFVNEDGTVLQTGNVAYGTTPVYTGATPEKAADAQYSYTFADWNTALVPVTGDVTYTATFAFSVNEYTVTFVNEDGTVLQTGNVAYGTMPVFNGTEPTKAGDAQFNYTFAGWTPALVSVTGNATYTATFTSETKTFTVIWKDVDGTVLETDYAVPYGTVATYDGAKPTKASTERYDYTFAGFQNSGNIVTEDVTYIASYTGTDRLYTVNFVYGNTVIKTESVKYEAAATAPVATEMPIVKNHKFTGWDVAFDCVTGDMTVTAQYTRTHHDSWDMKVSIGFGGVSGSDSTNGFINLSKKGGTIYDAKVFESFKNWPKSTIMEGTDYSSYTVKEGLLDQVKWNGVTYYNETGVQNPTHEDYFQIYKVELVATRGEYHMDNHATFYHTVTFVVDGVEYKVPVIHGEEIVVPADINLQKSGYEFTGWDTEFANAEKSMTITAQFVKLHTVTFKIPAYAQNEFGMKSKVTVKVREGETVEALALANGKNYEFVRWYQEGADYTKSYKFSTPITDNLTLVPYVRAIKADRDLYIYGEVNGQKFELGVGTITNVAWAGEFNGIYNNVLQTSKYKWSENVILPGEYADITVDGITYTYGEGTSKNFYTLEMTKKVHIIKNSGEFVYSANGAITLFHTVTYFLPIGGSYAVTAEHGSKLEPYWAEDACFAYEVVNYWYNNKGGAKLDFDTFVVDKSVGFSCKTKAKIGDWDVALTATFGDETFNLGTATLMNSAHAGNYRNNKQNIAYDETKMIMPELGNLEINGTTYYADSTKADFYTVDFNNLTCLSHKVNNRVKDWSYEFLGEIKLYHTVIFVVDGDFVYTTVEHGTAAVLPEGCDARSVNVEISNVTESMLVYVK